MRNFKGKVAAVTGAGSGMGREIALLLAKKGVAGLSIVDVNEKGLAETVRLVHDRYPTVQVTHRRVDVADRADVYAWADEVVRDHGTVNLIFNNAGVALGSLVADMRYEDFEWLFNINFWGVVYGTKAFLPYLEASGDGHIINTSSIFGLASVPSQSAYNAAKSAVKGFTEALREELDMANNGVSATTVHPGGIKTNIARDARMDPKISKIGLDSVTGKAKIEKTFVTSPESAAKTILNAVWWNKRRVLVGPDAVIVDLMVRLFPRFYQRLVIWYAKAAMSA